MCKSLFSRRNITRLYSEINIDTVIARRARARARCICIACRVIGTDTRCARISKLKQKRKNGRRGHEVKRAQGRDPDNFDADVITAPKLSGSHRV